MTSVRGSAPSASDVETSAALAGESAERAAKRHAELDLLKAAGIVAVVLIHALRGPFEPDASAFELRLNEGLRFAVPAFLFASGALVAFRPRTVSPGAALRARLARLLLPYLVASAAAEVYLAARGLGPATGNLLFDFLFGAAFGPYYYVFVALGLVLVESVVQRLGGRAIVAITVLFLVGQGASEALLVPLPLFWHLRSPLLWWAYWFLGFLYAREHDRVATFFGGVVRHGIVAAAAACAYGGALAIALAASPLALLGRISGWLAILAALAALLAIGRVAPLARSRVVRGLSGMTYAIYLWHLFAVYPLREAATPEPGVFDPLRAAIPWIAGVLAPAALAVLVRRVFGARSARKLLGA